MCDCSGTYLNGTDLILEEENCSYIISQTQEEVCCDLTSSLEVEGRLIICITGMIFNTLAIFTLFEKKLSQEIFNQLIICLVMMDNLYLLIGVLEVWIHGLEQPSYEHLYFFFYFIYPLRGLIMCCIIYMTVVLAFHRYRSITKPLTIRMRNQSSNGASCSDVLKLVAPVILFSIAFQIPSFLEIDTESYVVSSYESFNDTTSSVVIHEKIEEYDTHDVVTRLVLSDLRSHHMYNLLYLNIANIAITGIIPVFLLTYFNFFIGKGMKKFVQQRSTRRQKSLLRKSENDIQEEQENKNQRTQTIILFAIVIIFILCHSLRIILNVEEFVIHSTTMEDLKNSCRYGYPFWVLIGHPISEVLLKLNSSVNFFIYCAFNNCFRKALRSRFSCVFTLCRRRQSFSTRTRTSSNDSRTIHDQTNATMVDATELTTLNNASHQASLIQ